MWSCDQSLVTLAFLWEKFRTGTRYGLEILHQCGKKIKTKIQEVLGSNSNVSRSYREKTGRGPFLAPTILNRVNIHIERLNTARCTSWIIIQSCFAFMKSMIYIGFLLGSMRVRIKNFAVGSISSWVVENVIPIPFNPPHHDRFITPCPWLKGDLHSSIPLIFIGQIYPQPFATKD